MPDRLADVRKRLQEWLARCGLPAETIYDLVLAVSEACSNAVEHGYRGEGGMVRLHVSAEETELRITISDAGRWKSRAEAPDPTRGRGLDLIRALVPAARITGGADGTVVDLRVSLIDT
ncbi:ATP-binding protein [Nocardia sp. NPDC004068]|uniref:ATP-binding protein n=1 Tax=Nocardia sp. NPDC004068 TaxID=3364303 RepID=UPI00369A982A